MKDFYKKISHLLIVAVLAFSVFTIAHAATGDYNVLTPLPGIGGPTGKTTNIADYLPNAFNLVIGIAAVMAFVMITFGGVTYATSDAIQGKSQGREYIENAIWGLVLVIGAYVILYTINPQILQFDLTLPKPTIPTTAVTATAPVSAEGDGGGGATLPAWTPSSGDLALNSALVSSFSENHVHVDDNPCKGGKTTGCVTIAELPDAAIAGLEAIGQMCQKSKGVDCVTVTGGTEGGHESHGPGKPVVDLANSAELNQWIYDQMQPGKGGIDSPSTNPPGFHVYTFTINGRPASFMHETDHWHVTFK